ncbi:hypothetical protein G1H11_04860 [Phytoactinopolyspora alkaliphila]|uniref:Nucleotidyl transferase AbiEii/AbiGii toxin family protein n=1 Tax=Phytoactinopolyspora alkaliphila TaxID=1783498 RepID=A0A6N9YI58_9ACTN|nr:hypothetical protein [Phytoactinopolyspora alkaliphila]
MNALTAGWLARHTPPGAGGRYAALIDIAQDLLLTHLAEQGMFDHLVFKGGTALRKLYAGNAGRFSTDLDFSVHNPADDPNAVAELLRAEIDGQQINGFTYHVTDRRGPSTRPLRHPIRQRRQPHHQTRHRTSPLAASPRTRLDTTAHPPRIRPARQPPSHGPRREHGRKDRPARPPDPGPRRLRPSLDRHHQPALQLRPRHRPPPGHPQDLGRPVRPVITTNDLATSHRRRGLPPRTLEDHPTRGRLRRRQHRPARHPRAQPGRTQHPTPQPLRLSRRTRRHRTTHHHQQRQRPQTRPRLAHRTPRPPLRQPPDLLITWRPRSCVL